MSETDVVKKHYRYRGPLPYQDRDVDRSMFFGREREAKKLLSLVLSERLTVLFAKSGLGKTSLINAGLMDKLRSKKYFPVRVTFNTENMGLIESVLLSIEEKASQTGVKIKSPKKADRNNLWSYFSHTEFLFEKKKVIPVLILDQFEEVFTVHTREETEQFIQQIAPLIRNIAPKPPVTGKRKSSLNPYAKINIKILIGIREDYLAELEGVAKKIPQILRNRYRLLPLSRKSAKLAIENPVEKEGDFYSHAYKYSPPAINKILNFLSCVDLHGQDIREEDTVVEPAQLQLICQSIENQIIERGENESNIINQKDIGGTKGLQKIIKKYYNYKIGKIRPFSERNKVRKLFRKGLISRGDNRVSLAGSTITDTYHLSELTLTSLVDARLLRSESRNRVTYYEIPHDTLVGPIRQLQKERDKILIPIYITLPFVVLLLGFQFAKPVRKYIASNEMNEYRGKMYLCLEEACKTVPDSEINYTEIEDIDRVEYGKFVKFAIKAKRQNEIVYEYTNLIRMPNFSHRIDFIYNTTMASIPSDEKYLHSKILLSTANYYAVNKALGDPFFLFQIAKEMYDLASNYEDQSEEEKDEDVKAHLLEEAKNVFKMAVDLQENFNHDYFLADIHYYLGKIAEESDECRMAHSYFNIAIEKKGQYTDALHVKCNEEIGQKNNSETVIKQLEVKPSRGENSIHKDLEGTVELMQSGQLDEARTELTTFIELNPDSASGYYYKGIVEAEKEEYLKAIDSFSQAIDRKEDYTKALKARAYYQMKKGQYGNAAEDYEILLRKSPDNETYLLNIALCYENMEENEKAITYYKTAISLKPDNPVTYYKLAQLYQGRKFLKISAIPFYKKALEKDPTYFEAAYELARAYQSQDEYQNAIEYYKLAYSIRKKVYLKFRLADMHRMYAREQTAKMEYKVAMAHYEKSLGYNEYDKKSLDEMAILYYTGKGGNPNYKKAYNLFSRSADLGSEIGQYYLGMMFYRGEHVQLNYNTAFTWLSKSADQGYVEAQYQIGIMFLNGRGTSESLDLALDFFTRAARQNHKEAAKSKEKVEMKIEARDQTNK